MSTLITLITLNILVLAAVWAFGAGRRSRQLGRNYETLAGGKAPWAVGRFKSVNWNGGEGDKKGGGK